MAAVRPVSTWTVHCHCLCAHLSDLLPQACPFLWTWLPLAHPMFARCYCTHVLQAIFKRGGAGLAAISFLWSTDLVPEDPGFTGPEKEAAEPLAALGPPYCRHHPGSGSASLLGSGKLTSSNAAFAHPPPHPELWVATYSILPVSLPHCIRGNVSRLIFRLAHSLLDSALTDSKHITREFFQF